MSNTSGQSAADNDDAEMGQFIRDNRATSTGTGTGGSGMSTSAACQDTANFECRGGIAFPKATGLSDAPISTILLNILRWLLGIFGTIAVIAFVISGLQYLTAAGDEERMESGKNNMKYSIIGIIIGLFGLIVVQAIDAALRGTPFF